MVSWGRTLIAVVLLAAFGAVAGTVVGYLVLFAWAVSVGGFSDFRFGTQLMLAFLVGGPLGAVSTPLLSLLFLRRIPLGKAIAITSTSAVIGSVGLAHALVPLAERWAPSALIGGGVVGFLVAAVVLRLRQKTYTSEESAPRATPS